MKTQKTRSMIRQMELVAFGFAFSVMALAAGLFWAVETRVVA